MSPASIPAFPAGLEGSTDATKAPSVPSKLKLSENSIDRSWI